MRRGVSASAFLRLGAAIGLAGLALHGPAQSSSARAATSEDIKIGVLTDMSGPYADLAGQGSVEAARMAIDEFGGKVRGRKIELVYGDHQNKPDIGASIARQWFDADHVDMIVDFSNSAVALAVQSLAKERNRIALITAASSDFTGKDCSPTSAQWVYNSYTNGYGLARAVTRQGLDTWFLITVDYAFGHAFAADISAAVKANGGKVLGEVRHPLNTADFSSFLLQAQSSGAKVVALANAGTDMINAVKQAAEFGVSEKQTLVAPIVFITDIHSMGLQIAHGLRFMTGFYWDLDDRSRAWSKRFFERRKVMPTMTQAGVYSAVLHYLRAIDAIGTSDALAVMAEMRKLPVEDAFSRHGRLREDGQMVHDMYLVEVKKPAESKGPWDYYKLLATIPADEAFRPLAGSACPLVHGQ
jgi:branched-chain amino acid transport system substrate-binding protein